MPGDRPLKHNPFASLRSRAVDRIPTPRPVATPATPQPLARIIVREEVDTEGGGLIARVIGVPRARLRAIGATLRSALGASVCIEGRDLLVTPNDCERVAARIREEGASEVVIIKRAEPTNLQQAGTPGGTLRAEIRRGLSVAVVTKADQDTDALTEGVVRDILTNSAVHPRGIKVRLEDGQVGRVRRILGPSLHVNPGTTART
jgi:uncharacterized repeat protein (TIGR03833 family)